MMSKIIGWSEWCSLPEILIPAVKAKIDTGAKTSCLHAFEITEYSLDDKPYINYLIHPIQNNKDIVIECNSPVYDQRIVTNSGGHRELRYVIRTDICLGNMRYKIDLNLTNRDDMIFRMLIGRKTIERGFLVDVSKKHLLGKISQKSLNKFYNIK